MNEPRPHSIAVDQSTGADESPSIGSQSTSPLLPHIPGSPVPAQLKNFGDYELVAEIARGGMGIVYKARQIRLNRLVALKMIRSGNFADEREIQRFHTEAEAAAKLDHPGIVPVYEVGEHAGQHYFSMALVPGQSLIARIKEQGPLPPRLAASMMQSIAEAVQYAHERGIVHRDLKPHNVLLDTNDTPRVTDFGLAKLAQSPGELTLTGQVMGTPSYMPPEQASGESAIVGPKADVYSLGATLYCMLGGRPPFQASSSALVLSQVLNDSPVPPKQLNPEVPADLETICLKCLRKELELRYVTAKELADDLERFLAGEPIHARPIGMWERGWKWARRRPVAAALSVVSLLAAFALVGVAVSVAYQMKLSGLNDALESRNSDLDAANQVANSERDAARRAKEALARHRYSSDLSTAGLSWQDGNLARMHLLLDRQIPGPGEPDLRGFEWHYLRNLDRHDVWRLENPGFLMSPDGRCIALSAGEEVQLLEPRTRRLIRKLDKAQMPIAFSGDGKRLIAAVGVSEVAVWDLESGKEVTRLLADDLSVAGALLNRDGTQAAAMGTGQDRAIRVWDVASGKQLHRWTVKGYVTLAVFSPVADRVAFRTSFTTVDVYDTKSGVRLNEIAVPPPSLEQLAYDSSGKWLIGTCGDDSVRCWDAETGRPALAPFQANGLSGSVIAFSPDGKFILTGSSRDNAIRLWEGTAGKFLSSRKGHLQKPYQVAVSPDGTLGLSTGTEGSTYLRDLRGPQEMTEITGSFGAIRNLRFSTDPATKMLAFVDERWRLHVTDGGSPKPLPGWNASAFQREFAPDGKSLWIVATAGEVVRWDLAAVKVVRTLPSTAVVRMTLEANGKRLATVGTDFIVRVWDAADGNQLYQFPAPKTANGVVGIYFQPGTDNLVIAHAFDGLQRIRLGDSPRIEQLNEQVKTFTLAFHPDGTRVATIGPGNAVTLRQFPSLDPLHTLHGHSQGVMNMRFSPDGRRLATSAPDQLVRIWDVETGQELLGMTSAGYFALDFSPDGRRLASAGQGGTIQIWNANEPVRSTTRQSNE